MTDQKVPVFPAQPTDVLQVGWRKNRGRKVSYSMMGGKVLLLVETLAGLIENLI